MLASTTLEIYQKSTFKQTIYYKDADGNAIDLTGYAARLQAKKNYADLIPLLDLSTDNGRITITALTGRIDIEIPYEATSLLDFTKGVYDFILINASNQVERLLQGEVILIKGVSERL